MRYEKIMLDKIAELSDKCKENYNIDQTLYLKYDVKRGLRDINGRGVLTGLTDISEVLSHKDIDGVDTNIPGELYYRGVDVKKIVKGFFSENRFGFEEVIYLLLFGKLPNKAELKDFTTMLSDFRQLPKTFVRDVIMKSTSSDIMNGMAKSVLSLYSYDKEANNLDIINVLKQSLWLISVFPMLAVYGYHAYNYYRNENSLIIHKPPAELGIAESILYMLRPDTRYTELEAKILDITLVLHAEHGGGNNSTFTNHVVTSSGTDSYSATAASLASLKGPKHGGANIKVVQMFSEMKKAVTDWQDENEVKDYLRKLLHKEAFDKSGLIYGMGHAIYTLSDPRADVFKHFVEDLAKDKNRLKEFELYSLVEKVAPEVIGEERRIYKGVSANVDFYSGFVYSMLDLPAELYTPIFAIARISGWSAHRIEELLGRGKIIRPAYMAVADRKEYVPLDIR
ncbi:MAG: citrate/2-methylcitrate synthase [Ruminococcus sp.]|jgi:citrate synthase|nr:citrate/2-methylcitrate synthase [Ruminococcus sp.]